MIDPLSQVLGSVRLTGGVFLEAHFTAPWCTLAHVTADHIRPFVEAPGEIIAYHFVVSGRMLCTLGQGPPMEVAAGEVVLLPRNGVHTLGSAAGLPPIEVSMSRSAFNERFTALVGMPPIKYLTHWRLQLAKEKLRDGRLTIARIAYAVGYESEVAFNRAFKREFGQPPARWRNEKVT